jgi:hypothetical protein
VTSRFVEEFPGEDSWGGFVASDNCFDVISICSLRGRGGIEGSGVAAESGRVGIDAAKVIPIVNERED